MALCGCLLYIISASTNFSPRLLFSSLEAGEETGAQRGDITGLREGLGSGIWSQTVFDRWMDGEMERGWDEDAR